MVLTNWHNIHLSFTPWRGRVQKWIQCYSFHYNGTYFYDCKQLFYLVSRKVSFSTFVTSPTLPLFEAETNAHMVNNSIVVDGAGNRRTTVSSSYIDNRLFGLHLLKNKKISTSLAFLFLNNLYSLIVTLASLWY